jgi:hypothetical protein
MNDDNNDDDENFLIQEEKPSATKSFVNQKSILIILIKNFPFFVLNRNKMI